jgi:hypothetical protein
MLSRLTWCMPPLLSSAPLMARLCTVSGGPAGAFRPILSLRGPLRLMLLKRFSLS